MAHIELAQMFWKMGRPRQADIPATFLILVKEYVSWVYVLGHLWPRAGEAAQLSGHDSVYSPVSLDEP